MKLRWNHEFSPTWRCEVGPDGGTPSGSGSGGSPGTGNGAAPTSPAPAATPSGSTPGPSTPAPASGTSGAAPSSASPSTPTVQPSSPGTEVGGDGDVINFDALFGPDPSGVAPIQPKPPEPAVTPPATPPAATPPATPQDPAASAAPPAPTPTTSTTPPAAAPGVPRLDPSDPASIATHLALNKDAAIADLSQRLFQLTPEDVEALESDVVGTVPKLLARAVFESQGMMLRQMANLVPQMIARQTVAMQANNAAEDDFYRMWPGINRQQHGELVRRCAVAYRQAHPGDTRQQMMEALGPYVMMAGKIPFSAAAPAAGAPTVPASPAPKPQPFVPAGGSSAMQPAQDEIDPVSALFQPR